MRFRQLYEEYQTDLVGNRIYELTGDLVRAKARRYPTALYNGGRPWDEDSFIDVHHEVLKSHLLDRGQIHFVFSEPDPVSDEAGYEGVCRRLKYVIGRALTDRLRDAKKLEVRLTNRVRKLATAGLIEAGTLKRMRYYRMPGSAAECRDLTDREIVACADLVRHLPRLPERWDSEKGSIGYQTRDLRVVTTTILSHVGAVSEVDFTRIFEVLFTPFTTTPLSDVEEVSTMPTDTRSDGALANMRALVSSYAGTLAPRELRLVVSKSQGVADEALRETIGASRPTLQKMRERVAEGLRDAVLVNIDSELLDDALDEFALRCAELLQEGRP